ncbi:MAG: polysaccharide biosynthesis protein [Candidatus Omnitrophica bacterium]|nr:polysaccharide biosynthesis protein [Candidatus Omnitrophota bacterium]
MKQIYAKDVLSSFALQIFENGRSFLLIPVIAKTLGASGYGIWIQVKIGIAFLCPFLLLGMGGGISRFLPGSSKNEISNGMFSSILSALTTGTTLALLVLLLGKILQNYIGPIPGSKLFIKGLALLCIAEPINNLCLEYFRAFRKMKNLFGISVLDTIFEFFPVFWLVYNGFGISAIIFFFACGRLIMAGIKTLIVLRKVGFGSFRMHILLRFIKFGFPLIWTSILFYISNYLDRYLIGYFHSVKEVGIYSLAYSIGYIVVLVSAPWDRVLVPTITAHWNEGNKTEVGNYFNNSLRYILITVIPLIAFLSIIGKDIIRIISTTEFFSAAPIIPLMLVTFLVFETGIFYQRIVMLIYNSLVIMKAFMVATVISIVLNLILIPRFSTVGAAVSLFITYGTLSIIFYRLANKGDNIFPFNWVLFLKCLLAVIPSCIPLFLNKTILFLNITMAISLYFILLWILKIIGKREIDFLKRLCYVYTK